MSDRLSWVLWARGLATEELFLPFQWLHPWASLWSPSKEDTVYMSYWELKAHESGACWTIFPLPHLSGGLPINMHLLTKYGRCNRDSFPKKFVSIWSIKLLQNFFSQRAFRRITNFILLSELTFTNGGWTEKFCLLNVLTLLSKIFFLSSFPYPFGNRKLHCFCSYPLGPWHFFFLFQCMRSQNKWFDQLLKGSHIWNRKHLEVCPLRGALPLEWYEK